MPLTPRITPTILSPVCFQRLQIVAIDFGGELPLTPLTASSMLSAMGCEKFQSTPGIFSSSRSMAAISSSLSSPKTGRH